MSLTELHDVPVILVDTEAELDGIESPYMPTALYLCRDTGAIRFSDRTNSLNPAGGGGVGSQGPAGPAGPEGPQGPAGTDGADGATGPAGVDGAAGPANLVMGRVAADVAQSSNVNFSNLFTRAVAAGEVWSFEAVLFFTSAATTTGIVPQMDTPASPAASQLSMFTQETATAGRFLPAAANATMVGTAALASSVVNTAVVYGTVENGVNAGNLVLKFRSEVNNSAITVKRGSFIRWFKH